MFWSEAQTFPGVLILGKIWGLCFEKVVKKACISLVKKIIKKSSVVLNFHETGIIQLSKEHQENLLDDSKMTSTTFVIYGRPLSSHPERTFAQNSDFLPPPLSCDVTVNPLLHHKPIQLTHLLLSWWSLLYFCSLAPLEQTKSLHHLNLCLSNYPFGLLKLSLQDLCFQNQNSEKSQLSREF